MEMMTGRCACDEVTFGMDPSECLTMSGRSQLSQAQLYPSSCWTPPHLAACGPSSAQGPLAVPSCSGSRWDSPPRHSLLHPTEHGPPPSRHKGSSGARVTGLWQRAAGPGWGLTPHSLPVPPEESLGGTALCRQGVQPTRGQALPATGSPRLPVPASPRSSSPGPWRE